MVSVARDSGAVSLKLFQLPEFAVHWARELGTGAETLVALKGGINSRVYRCGSLKGTFVVKGYQPAADGQRDRFKAEVEFLEYAAEVATGFVPKLLHVDESRRCLVLENLEGQPFQEGDTPRQTEIECAVEFFRRLNTNLTLASTMVQFQAAEGYLSLTAHLQNVEDRLSGMSTAHLPAEGKSLGQQVLDRLRDDYAVLVRQTHKRLAQGNIPDAIDAQERCVSPSDFGFHNALRTAQGVRFIDFEFAGWDDPAKAVVDFCLQPKVPVTASQFLLLLALPLAVQKQVRERCHCLLPILRLKWACIIAGVLIPARLERLCLVHPELELESFVGRQLSLAGQYLNRVGAYGVS